MLSCPLCGHGDLEVHVDDATSRRYGHCGVCALWSLDPAQRPTLAQAKAHYAHHRNDVTDPRYRAFAAPLADAVKALHAPGSVGLDFGSGAAPVLEAMLNESAYDVTAYDPIFRPDSSFATRRYDFIAACEVAEHFFDPSSEFDMLYALLRDGGTLVLSTSLVTERVSFPSWYYRLDPTHVSFYAPATFDWLRERCGFASVETDGRRLVILRK